MKTYPRLLESLVEAGLAEMPVVALLGPRQCGKTTLAGLILARRPDAIRPDRAFVAAPVAASYPLSSQWTVLSPADLPTLFDERPAP